MVQHFILQGEVEDKENNRTWGYTEYHKMKGYAPLDECRPRSPEGSH